MLQKQLNMQEVDHQRNVCETLFTTVSSSEKLALGSSKNKEYNNYDLMNSA